MYESQLSQKTPDHFVSTPCILQVCRYYAGIKSPKLIMTSKSCNAAMKIITGAKVCERKKIKFQHSENRVHYENGAQT